jgi:hypothetical protein
MRVSSLRKFAPYVGDSTDVLVCHRLCYRRNNLEKSHVNVYKSFLSFLVHVDGGLRYQIHLRGGMAVLCLGYVNEPPNSASGYPL